MIDSPKHILIEIGLGLLALVTAFSAGRFSAPLQTKTVIQEKIVYKDKVDDTKNQDTVTKTTQTKKPDGTVITVTDRESKTNEHKTDDISSSTTSTQTTSTENRPNWRVGGAYNPKVINFQPSRYSISVERRLFSEVYAGVNASNEHTYGINLSLGF